MEKIPFQITNWEKIPSVEHKGQTGTSYWKVLQLGNLRIRMVEYSANYLADHWCEKGHVIYCVKGEMETELADGSKFKMSEGMSYEVSDGMSSHRSYSEKGTTLFIVDGAFLNL
jgi:quercetin dioxygenase-like cupin family protein